MAGLKIARLWIEDADESVLLQVSETPAATQASKLA